MSRNSYTASERRGILAIALISLLLIGGGIIVTLIKGDKDKDMEYPIVTQHSEVIDSVAVKNSKKDKKSKEKKENKGRKSKSGNKSTKQKKVYRKRSPLDEPV